MTMNRPVTDEHRKDILRNAIVEILHRSRLEISTIQINKIDLIDDSRIGFNIAIRPSNALYDLSVTVEWSMLEEHTYSNIVEHIGYSAGKALVYKLTNINDE